MGKHSQGANKKGTSAKGAGRVLESEVPKRSKEEQLSEAQADLAWEQVRLGNTELIMDRMKLGLLPIYTADYETDPFKRDQVPKPFLAGLFDGLTFKSFETKGKRSCVDIMCDYMIDNLEPGIVYMHNGGRFDFFFMLPRFEGRTMIMGSRIVCALMQAGNDHKKKHKRNRFEFRDSYAIMPFPLAEYQKDQIDIQKLHKDVRAQHMPEITRYLRGDCVYLWDLCMGFQKEFGDYKTVASAAFAELTKFHKYETLPERQDKELRGQFYFGGRVQCFEKGVINAPISLYDVNSMYPYVMQNYLHPTGWVITNSPKLVGWNLKTFEPLKNEKLKTFFLTIEGENKGAFPVRQPDGSVDFTQAYGQFRVTIHEYLTALRLGLCQNMNVLTCYSFLEYGHFHLFVDHFYKLREKAKRDGDKMHALFYKYILNSAYGKFGLNPENYFNWQITKTLEQPKGNGWVLDTIHEDRYFIWKQPTQTPWNVKNIATAASITGAARCILLRAITESEGVLYCDTDSIICREFSGGVRHDKELGAWKLEGVGTRAAIAGKKMYAVFDETGACIKKAHKGIDATAEEILQLASGDTLSFFRDAPTFKRDGSAIFGERTGRMT